MQTAPYPNKEQILEKEIKFRKSTIQTVLAWKRKYYTDGKWCQINKNDALRELVINVANCYETKIDADIGPDNFACFDTVTNTLYLNSTRPSILTALHELAHAIKGNNEFIACRWSVWLFKKTFPKTYESLKWDGHTLKQ